MRAFFAQPLVSDTRVEISIEAPDGEIVATGEVLLERGSKEADLELSVPHFEAWSPTVPNLYCVRLVLLREGAIADEFRDRFGFRTIETREGHFYLNGEPLYLRAALDQDYYPDTICTTPSSTTI